MRPRTREGYSRELLRDGTSLRVAQDMGRIDMEIIQELRQIAGKLLDAIWFPKRAAAPMPAQIGHNRTVVCCQGRHHAVIHRAADHQAVDKQQW